LRFFTFVSIHLTFSLKPYIIVIGFTFVHEENTFKNRYTLNINKISNSLKKKYIDGGGPLTLSI